MKTSLAVDEQRTIKSTVAHPAELYHFPSATSNCRIEFARRLRPSLFASLSVIRYADGLGGGGVLRLVYCVCHVEYHVASVATHQTSGLRFEAIEARAKHGAAATNRAAGVRPMLESGARAWGRATSCSRPLVRVPRDSLLAVPRQTSHG